MLKHYTFLILVLAVLGVAHPVLAAGEEAPKAFTALPSLTEKALTGFTRARAHMDLVSEVSGRCLEVLADVGQTIAPDGIFARLDPTFVRLDLEANRIEQSRLKSRVEYLEKEVNRRRSLVKRKSEPQSSLDAQEQEYAQAEHQYKGLVTAGKILEERLTRYTIKAPPGWKVIERKVEPGQWVAQGSTLARLGDFTTLLVPLALTPQEYQTLMAMPRPLSLRLPHLDREVRAKVERVSPAFDPVTRKINLDMAIDGGPEKMRGGLYAELILSLPDPAGAVLVPAEAVAERYQEHWLTTEDGKQVRVVVLGPGPDGLLRVVSPKVGPDMRFLFPGE